MAVLKHHKSFWFGFLIKYCFDYSPTDLDNTGVLILVLELVKVRLKLDEIMSMNLRVKVRARLWYELD